MNEVTGQYEVFCDKQEFVAHLGLRWCRDGHFPCNADCPYRTPQVVTYTTTSTSTEQ